MSRRVLACVACAWLLWHVSATVGVLAAEWPAAASTACDCTHGPGAMCPMHKTAPGRLKCALGFAAALDASALLTLLGPVGLPTSPTPSPAVVVGSATMPHASVRAGRILTPDAPPPRL